MSLEEKRKAIDGIDAQIVKLLAERMRLATWTRKEKEKSGKGIEDTARERQVLDNIEKAAKVAGIKENVASRIFEEIMAASRGAQREDVIPKVSAGSLPATVAFQGERGAYSEEALSQILPNAKPVPQRDFSDVFDAVQFGKTDAGLVPIENSTEGSINQIYDLLLNSQLSVSAETFLRVKHNLVGMNGTEIRPDLPVYSHPQALAQCRAFIKARKLTAVQYYDTAGAAKDLAFGKIEGAAIASLKAAKTYGLQVLEEGIEDNRNNYTRFIIISKIAPDPQPDFKTSIVFSTAHKPGALFRVLKAFASAQINLTKIESRPTKKTPWEYVFYLDFEGSAFHEPAKSVLDKIKTDTLMLKVLGSYPKAR